MTDSFFSSLPMSGVVIAFGLLALILYELGFRFGRWWQDRTPDEKEGPTGMIVGSILGLLAFLLAITMGMAVERYDARRGVVLEEANSIGTTYLRAGYLPEPASSRSRELLREYVPLRVAPRGAELAEIELRLQAANEILSDLWSIAEDLARETPESDVLAIYIEALNDTIDVNSMRVTAGIYARVPQPVLILLIVGAAMTLGVVGFSAGLSRHRSPLTALVLIVVLGAVIALIIDIDTPERGTLTVSQRPIIELAEQIGAEVE